MRICLAQIQSETGELKRNAARHLATLEPLRARAVDLVAFPELSLSNYAPSVADACAVQPSDESLAPFQQFADETDTAVAVGAPLKSSGKPVIAVLAFVPGRTPTIIGKRHLHADESPYFSPFRGSATVLDLAVRVGIAICYEISVAAHSDELVNAGAAVYLASVAKTPSGVAAAREILSETARRHGIPALLVNSVGTCEGKPSGGSSMIVSRKGQLLGQLGDLEEGLLIYDTTNQATTALPIAA